MTKDLGITKEWFEKHAAKESGEIGAGMRKVETPEYLAELERLAFEALPAWARNELSDLRRKLEDAKRALEPFEELADEGNDDEPDKTRVVVQAGRSTVYTLWLSDLRQARDVYRALTARATSA